MPIIPAMSSQLLKIYVEVELTITEDQRVKREITENIGMCRIRLESLVVLCENVIENLH